MRLWRKIQYLTVLRNRRQDSEIRNNEVGVFHEVIEQIGHCTGS